jgi:ArsR family transcriptional regulator
MNATSQRLPIFEQMTALSDGVRSRILVLLEGRELTVSEMGSVFQLPQSTTSRHLKILADGGWVVSRRNGTHRLYRMAGDDISEEARRLWGLVREQVSAEPAAEQDARRLRAVLDRRRERSQEFFAASAGDWDRLRDELFGQRAWLGGLLGLLDGDWIVADLGCGTGRVSETLAPFVGRVIAVDDSEAMLAAAGERLADFGNVEVRSGALGRLPIEDGSLDAATLVLVLHHLPDPGAELAEVARTLRPGGRLLVVDLMPHDRAEYHQDLGHVWAGFSREQLEGYSAASGLELTMFEPLPADPDARGPALFAAACRRPRA